jgi:hypothetical protein
MPHDVRDQDFKPQQHGNDGLAFKIVGGTGVPGTKTQPNPWPDVTCHKHGKVGHYSQKCKETMHANSTALVNVGTEQVPQDGTSSILGADGAASAAPTDDVAMTMLVGDTEDSVCSLQFLQNGVADQRSTVRLLSPHKAMTVFKHLTATV